MVARDTILFVAGIALILIVSLTEGFAQAVAHAINHLQFDVFTEGLIHLYILGWILVAYFIVKK